MLREYYRGIVHGGQIVLLEGGDSLKEGTEVFVSPVGENRGSPQALLTALESLPNVPPEWVCELEEAIAAGKRPATSYDPFSPPLEMPRPN